MHFIKNFVFLLCVIVAIINVLLLEVNGSYPSGTVLDIQLGNVVVEEFVYEPTREGYRFGYTLPDGTRRDEVGLLLNANSSQDDLAGADAYSKNDRPSRRPGIKNRKLSPGALKSAAG